MSYQDLVILLVFSWIILTQYSRYKKYMKVIFLGVFIGLIWILLGFLVSDFPIQNAINVCKFLNTILLFPICCLILLANKKNQKLAINTFVISAIISSVLLFISGQTVIGDRISGYCGDPVMFSFLLSFASIFVLFEANRKSWFIIVKTCILLILYAQILLTGSGSGILLVAVSFGVYVFQGKKFSKFLKSGFTFGTVFLIFWNSPLSELTKSRLTTILNPTTHYTDGATSGQSTIEARKLSLDYAINQISHSPIMGSGFAFNDQITSFGIQPHNFLILLWMTGGLIGLTVGLSLMYYTFKVVVQDLKQEKMQILAISICTWIALMSASIFWDAAFFSALFISLFHSRKNQL